MEHVYSADGRCLSPRDPKMYRLLGDCFASPGRLGRSTAAQFRCAVAAYELGLSVLRTIWGDGHAATIETAALLEGARGRVPADA